MRIGLRPEHLRIAPVGQGVLAQVVLAEHLGDSSIIHLRVEGVEGLLNAKVGANYGDCNAGQTVGLVPDANWALPFGEDGRLMV
ncbi:MAG: TOBE domain-containing protein [Rhodoferax sp.]|nr:TOBE domain-containing protein [Rhodoferax sp.]